MVSQQNAEPDDVGGLRIVRVTDLRECVSGVYGLRPPLLLLSASADKITVGPLYIPGRSVCFGCVGHWARTSGWDRPPLEPPSPRALSMASTVALEIASRLNHETEVQHLCRAVWEIPWPGETRSSHPVYPLANCPLCASLSREEFPLTVHCSPLTGVVRSVEVTAEPFAGSYAAAGRYVAPLPVGNVRPLLRAQLSFGKGHTKQQAVDSCIAEALERYSVIYTGAEPLRRARLDEIAALDPRDILQFSPAQYARRDEWNPTHDERFSIPERFDPSQPLDFLPGLDLVSREAVGVPAACCLMWYRFRPGEPRFANADTIGCGAGRNGAAALATALLEWIERDAVAIWWYNRLQRPAVDARSFGFEPLTRISEALDRANRHLHLLDVRTDLNVPTYVAVAPHCDGSEPIFAAAAHPSPRLAACKAAAEAAQIYFAMRHQPEVDGELQTWLGSETVDVHPYLCPAGMIDPPPEPAPLNEREQVALCVRTLAAAGLRVVAVDHSRSDVLLKTMRAVVPGLAHVWTRFAPDRLYQVPVLQGWLAAPTPEEDLNSIPCMI